MKFFTSNAWISRMIRKLTVFHVVFLIIFCGFVVILSLYLSGSKPAALKKTQTSDTSQCPSYITLIRENDASLTHPLLLADVETESPNYLHLKVTLSKSIQKYVMKGSVQSASVYMRQLNDASWMSINGDQTYLPGSLMKLPIMIYFLKEEELHGGVLNKELFYEKPHESFPEQAYRGDSIKPGRKYKISELLRYMIEESDNNATHLLSKNIKADDFRRIFTDLDIPPDELNDVKYQIVAKNYAKFLRILYNATFLEEKLSQYALNLLANCKFTDGIVRKLPPGITVARKFGERGIDNLMDFSEGGIVYKDGNPYILVVMTRGTNQKDQVELISELSLEVFQSLKGI